MGYAIHHDPDYDTVELKTSQGKLLLLDRQQARQLAFDILHMTDSNSPPVRVDKDWRP